MLKTIFIALLSFNVIFSNGLSQILNGLNLNGSKSNTGTLEKMIAANGSVALDLNLNRLNGTGVKDTMTSVLRFDVERDSFFTVLVFNNELRGPLPGSMALIPKSSAALPACGRTGNVHLSAAMDSRGNP